MKPYLRISFLTAISLILAPISSLPGAADEPARVRVIEANGGGEIRTEDEHWTLGLTLECGQDGNQGRDDHLEIHWDQHVFRLSEQTSATCDDNDPDDPNDGGTYEGTGVGTCDGEEATASWTLIDGGGSNEDTVEFSVGGGGEPEILLSQSSTCSTEFAASRLRGARTARNIRTGATIKVKATSVPAF